MRIERSLAFCGALGAGLAVAAGAFGAHALRDRLIPELLGVFTTAASYQMYHSLALLALAALCGRGIPAVWAVRAAAAFVAGMLLFCGSLYALVMSGQRAFGLVTPFGGVLLLLGWVLLAIGAMRNER